MTDSAVRPLAQVQRFARLPVWPVWAGAMEWTLEQLGLRPAATWLEERCGGRVQPMFLRPEQTDPFLLMVHHRHSFSPWDPVRPLSALVLPEGFPAHPHRGFETVTYVLEGAMRHRDSTGVKMTYGAGSVQWLTAGRGVLHEEMWVSRPGAARQELYQIWVNLPRSAKMSDPQIQLLGPVALEYGQERVDEPQPLPVRSGDGVELRVLAGAVDGVRSPLRTRSPITMLHLGLTVEGSCWDWDGLPPTHTALFHVRRGAVDVAGTAVPAGATALFERGEAVPSQLTFTAIAPDTELLLLTGQPLGEPVAMGGSMVMTSDAEVEQAYRDFQAGAFGPVWSHRSSDADWLARLGR